MRGSIGLRTILRQRKSRYSQLPTVHFSFFLRGESFRQWIFSGLKFGNVEWKVENATLNLLPGPQLLNALFQFQSDPRRVRPTFEPYRLPKRHGHSSGA
jgi:hypothetical protein